MGEPIYQIDWATLNDSVIMPSSQHECLKGALQSGSLDVECVTKTICPQLAEHYLKMGIVVLVCYGFISWGCWYFFNYGYKYLGENNYFMDLDHRLYWDMFIRGRLSKFMALYIAMIVYLQWG